MLEPEASAGAGILGCLGDELLGWLLPILRLLIRGQGLVLLGDRLVPVRAVSVDVTELGDAPGLAVAGDPCWSGPRAVRALSGDRVLELGCERCQGPGKNVDLMLGELGPIGQQDGLRREQPLEAQQQRVTPAPLRRGSLPAGIELVDGGRDRAVAGAARRQVGGRLPLEQNRLARERTHALQLIRWDRPGRTRGDFD